jgi:hypothetical protein
MAEPTASKDENAQVPVNSEFKGEIGTLNDFLRRYHPSAADEKKDTLQNRYRVELSTPLHEFDTKTARSFAVTDMADPTRLLFCHICQPGTVQRHRTINVLTSLSHQYILPLVASGSVQLSRPEEERFAIVYERPQGKKLSEVLAQRQQPITQNFLCDQIIAPLAIAINQFAELDITHGCINPDNIYFNDVAILGPCVSEPCGYSQTFYCEPIERMLSAPAAKGDGSTAQDFYAMAVIVLYVVHGAKHFADMTPESLMRSILQEGVYSALTGQKDMPEIFYDFFRGLLNQNDKERWNYRLIGPWLEGKRYNVLPPPPPSESIRPFEFNGQLANTRRELAYLFSIEWDKISDPVRTGKLGQWVAVSLRNKELVEKISRISRTIVDLGFKNEMQLNEQLMHVIMLLDPNGPIRLKNLSFYLDGIDTMCAELYTNKANQELQLLAKFIEFNMGNYWLELQRKSVQEYTIPTPINAMLIKLERLRSFLRYGGLGFGLERMLYELNPEMPCLSPVLRQWHVLTLQQLLLRLDRLAPNLSKEDEPLDRHMAAFLASRLGIQHEIRLHELASSSSLANNRAIIALHLLSLAQQRCANMQLPGLTHWLTMLILPALDAMHSRTLKRRIKEMLMEKAKVGYTQLLADIIVNSNYAASDQASFHQAWSLYLVNESKIEAFRRSSRIDQESIKVGFMIGKFIAYASFVLSLYSSIRMM